MTEGPVMPAVAEVHGDAVTPPEETRLEPTQGLDQALVIPSETVISQIPELIHYEYEPLLRSLDADCRRIVATAHAEAEAIRNEAREESRRRISSAHREEAMILSRAADQQVVIYRDTQNEVARRLDELEHERAAVLAAARADAEDMTRSAKDAEDRARSELQSAEHEARAIIARANQEVRNLGGSPATSHHEEQVSWRADAARELDELFQDIGQSRTGPDEPVDRARAGDPAPEEGQPLESAPSATEVDPAPTLRRVRHHKHWWSRKH